MTPLLLVILTCALLGATGRCLGVAGVALALWLPAAIDAAADGALAARAAWLGGALLAALLVWGLVCADGPKDGYVYHA